MAVDSTSELRDAAKADVKGRSEESRRIFPRLNPPPLAVHRSRELDYQGSGETRVHAMGWLAGRSFSGSASFPTIFSPRGSSIDRCVSNVVSGKSDLLCRRFTECCIVGISSSL